MSRNRIALLLIVCAVVLLLGLPVTNYLRAESAFKAERYDEALELYENASRYSLFFRDDIKKGRERTLYAIAEKAVEDADFDRAIGIYEDLQDQDSLNKTMAKAADDAMSNKRYEQAADYYDRMGDADGVDDAWIMLARENMSLHKPDLVEKALEKCNNGDKVLALRAEWADDLADEGDYDNAIAQYRILGDAEKEYATAIVRADRLISEGMMAEAVEGLDGYAGSEVAECVARAAEGATEGFTAADAATEAGEFGRHIIDTNTQLKYCNLLRDKQLNLSEVYPTGVVVDADLAKYQLSIKSDDEREPTCKRVLVFSRTESTPPLGPNKVQTRHGGDQLFDELNEKRTDSDFYHYETRLMPGLMDELLDYYRADSMEECTAIVLLEKSYIPEGFITHTSTRTSSYGLNISSTYTVFPHFAAYEAICIYDVEEPTVFLVYDAYVEPALVNNAVFGNVYADEGVNISREEIAKVKAAYNDPENEESKEILSKYDEKTLKMIIENDSGEYFIIPTDDGDPLDGAKCTGDNYSTWNTEAYVVGQFNESWLQSRLDDGAMSTISIYILSANSFQLSDAEDKTTMESSEDSTKDDRD